MAGAAAALVGTAWAIEGGLNAASHLMGLSRAAPEEAPTATRAGAAAPWDIMTLKRHAGIGGAAALRDAPAAPAPRGDPNRLGQRLGAEGPAGAAGPRQGGEAAAFGPSA